MSWDLTNDLRVPSDGADQSDRAEAASVLAEGRRLRLERDFAGAARLAEAAVARWSGRRRADAACEAALAVAHLDTLGRLGFPGTEDGRRRLAARLHASEPHIAAALDADPDCATAHLLAGVLAWCRDADEDAVAHLTRIDGLLASASEPERRLLPAARFHRALAGLRLLEPGADGPAYEEITAAMTAGYLPPPSALSAACQALATHGSPHATELVARVAGLVPDAVELAGLVAQAAATGDERAGNAARALARARTCSPAARFDLLTGALTGAEHRADDERVLAIVDEIEVALGDVGEAGLDGRWADRLLADHMLRAVLGPANADVARIGFLRRIGRTEEAADRALALFHRAAAGASPDLDPVDLLDLLAELGTGEPETATLRRLLPHEDLAGVTTSERRPITILFVGGNETQQRYHRDVDESVGRRYGGTVRVEWLATGWGSNWARALRQVQARCRTADALVIMTFVRTTFGERVRSTAGAAGIPWVACTGHGRAAVERAIDRAVAVAAVASEGE